MPTLDQHLTFKGLAAALDLQPRELRYWAFRAQSGDLYTRFQMPKRRGGSRDILAPKAPLRSIQRRILRLLCELQIQPGIVHGLIGGRNIVTNAAVHCDKPFVLNLDLKDFFPSINFGRVRGALMHKPACLQPSVATVLARLTCFDNQLPQGAPTSSFLANLVCKDLDQTLFWTAKRLGCTCTRYADDITISAWGGFPEDLAVALDPPHGTSAAVSESLAENIELCGFTVNEKKVWLAGRRASQRVTGLIVNDRKPNVDRKLVRQIRGMIHTWEAHGLETAERVFIEKSANRYRAPWRGPPSFKHSLLGKLQFMAMVRGKSDPVFLKLARRCRALDSELFPKLAASAEQTSL